MPDRQPTLTIRPYVETDFDACLAIFDSNVPKYFAKAERPDFAKFLRIPNAEFLVASVDGIALGCGGSYLRGGIGRLCWGMVHASGHHCSIGSTLLASRLDHLFNVAKASEVHLETGQHSAAFFARFGFRIVRVVVDGFAQGIDCVHMSLKKMASPRP